MWAHREVSTWGLSGHFGADSRYERAAQAACGGGEATDRRTDVRARCVGGQGSAGARSECQPGVCVAASVSAGVAGRGPRNGEFAAGACHRNAIKQSASRGPSASCTRNRGSSGRDLRGTSQGTIAHHGACGRGSIARRAGAVAGMIGPMLGPGAGTRIWIVAGVTDMRRGFVGLSGMVQTALAENPFSGQVFVFRGKRGDLVKLLWWDGDGLCLFAKRLERGKFTWPQATNGTVSLTPAQLSMLLEGIDWRRPVRSYAPQMAV